MKKYTWEQINETLLSRGYSPKHIGDILSTLVKMTRDSEDEKEIKRIKKILYALPRIREIIKDGGKWKELKSICEPLGLSDTEFRSNPTLDDYLVDYNYWAEQLTHL